MKILLIASFKGVHDMTYDIKCKAYCGNEDCFENVSAISSLNVREDIVFDFTNLTESTPFNMLLISNTINQLRKKFPNFKMSCNPKGSDDYLGHVGFYNSCSLDVGKKMGEARANNKYVPITLIDLDKQNFYNEIEYKASQLSSVLKFDSNLSSFMEYIFIETIRNVFEHAQTLKVKVCAQKWPSHDLVEIAIADQGCGIATAMRKRFPSEGEKELLHKSCKPGVSANTNHSILSRNDPWRNSGFGLYALKALTLEYGGSFILCSGNHAFRQSREGTKSFLTNYEGTALCLRFSTNKDLDFEKVRTKIILEGERIAKEDRSAHKTASKSSGGKYSS